MTFDLNTLWFVLIAILFTGFFVLEGFDFGVGMLLPFLGKTDEERRRIINTIGPFWDGNEVWVLTAGGAMFAAFPHWYATLFSGFYLALLLMLVAMIVRGAAFEFRSKDRDPQWRATWDWMIFFGSAVPALLWGVAIGNLLKGVPIDANKHFVGGFFDLLSPYTLIAGVTLLLVFLTHGAIFLHLKSTRTIRHRAAVVVKAVGPVATVAIATFVVGTYAWTDSFARLGVNPGLVPVLAVAAMLGAGAFVHRNAMGWAFAMTCVAMALSVATVFMSLYPRVMVSSLNPDWSLTIYNASSTPYTLTVMSVVALIFVPIVLAYQGWTYWVFRHRVGPDTTLEY
ncbi:MAG: cytochrome d ubiquinol oxidase, subunit [Acidobacteria bacterium]|jgi:cytochrome d ubiquinol oxidase subunit II|nr:cytochrome d ubiquinol oxidase, subunit [Acidobacteriota bacterium]